MADCDVLVCGHCHAVFHFMELFSDHKSNPCNKDSSLKENVSTKRWHWGCQFVYGCNLLQRETKPKIWAFMLWKSSQLRGEESENVSDWKMYQIWVKLEEAIRETWIVAGRTIQSFAKVCNLRWIVF